MNQNERFVIAKLATARGQTLLLEARVCNDQERLSAILAELMLVRQGVLDALEQTLVESLDDLEPEQGYWRRLWDSLRGRQ